jgi:hypothetical protein
MPDTKPVECPIKYIVVEAIRGDEKSLISTSIDLGLFQGVLHKKLHTSDKEAKPYLLMKCKDKTLKTLCLTYYNILSLERFDGITKVVTFFRSCDEDKVKAYEMAKDLVEQMRKANRTLATEDEMIDISTYSEVPEAMGATKIETDTAKDASFSRYQNRSTVGQGTGTGVIHHHRAPVKKPIVPSLFKRIGRRPSKTTLDAMDVKVQQIAEGTYETTLPEIEGDAEEKLNPTVDDDNYDAQYFQHG